jgi:hypothetical protein
MSPLFVVSFQVDGHRSMATHLKRVRRLAKITYPKRPSQGRIAQGVVTGLAEVVPTTSFGRIS